MQNDIIDWLPSREGHFALESGHHGHRWLDLETLCLDARRAQAMAARLAERLSNYDVDVICGPLIEGAFIALMVSAHMDRPFTYAVPSPTRQERELFPITYQLPAGHRDVVRGRRVAIVNDVIGAGSAVRGTAEDLQARGATVVVIASLAVLGGSARILADEHHAALECLTALPNTVWAPSECPLCRDGVPLTSV